MVEELWHGNYTVLLNSEPWPFRKWIDKLNTYIYINYTSTEHEITIITEFSATTILLSLIMTASTVALTAKTGI